MNTPGGVMTYVQSGFSSIQKFSKLNDELLANKLFCEDEKKIESQRSWTSQHVETDVQTE